MPRDFTSGIDDEDLMNTRANRNSTVKRPDLDPGMDDDDDWGNIGGDSDSDDGWGSSFGSKDSFGGFGDDSFGDGDSFGGGSFGGGGPFGGNSFGGNSFGGNSFGGNSFGGGSFGSPQASGFGNPQFNSPNGMQDNTQGKGPQSYEDAFWDGVAAKGKKGWNVITDLFSSFSHFTPGKRVQFGRTMIFIGIAYFVLAILFRVFSVPVAPMQFFLMGGLTLGFGLVFFAFFYGKTSEETIEQPIESNPAGFVDMNSFEESTEEDSFNGFDEEENEKSDSDDDPFSNLFEEDDEDDKPQFSHSGFAYASEDTDGDEVKDPEEVLKQIDSVDKNYMTRQFLYEKMIDTLEVGNSHFSDSVILDEDSREFLTFAKYLEDACEVVKKDKSAAPTLAQVEDKLFYTLLTINRPSWVKDADAKNIMNEIISQYSYNPETGEKDTNITGSYNLVGKNLIIKIMKGETATITVRDVYKKLKDQILDTKNKIPVVLGVNSEGVPILEDLKGLHSFIICGEPRSGKSWAVKNIVAQMMMMNSPKEIQFHIIDTKGRTSDWSGIEVPHVREFASTPAGAMKILRHFCQEEAERRSQFLFEQGNYKDIADFKKDHPEIDFPYIYVLIDEVIDLVSQMDKETKTAFFSLLKSFTSKLPSYGIRLMLVPHMVKNSVIDKTVTDMIPNRFCVRGTPDKVEDTLFVNQKEFPQRLVYQGDMAVHLQTVNEKAFFCHSTIVSKTNQGYDKFFDFLTSFWLKMCPELFAGSKLENDLHLGLKQISDYPILREGSFDLRAIEMKMENSKNERISKMPKRPKISKAIESEYDIKEQEDDIDSEESKVRLSSDEMNELLGDITNFEDDEDIFL